MKIVSKAEMALLPAGTVFSHMNFNNYGGYSSDNRMLIKASPTFGAMDICPDVPPQGMGYEIPDRIFEWDLSLYSDDYHFLIYEPEDVLELIHRLTAAYITGDEKDKDLMDVYTQVKAGKR